MHKNFEIDFLMHYSGSILIWEKERFSPRVFLTATILIEFNVIKFGAAFSIYYYFMVHIKPKTIPAIVLFHG